MMACPRTDMKNVVSYLSQTDAPQTRPCETIDTRGLAPPEPLENTLDQLEEIDESIVLVQLNDRPHRDLQSALTDRGYAYETFEDGETSVTVIWTD